MQGGNQANSPVRCAPAPVDHTVEHQKKPAQGGLTLFRLGCTPRWSAASLDHLAPNVGRLARASIPSLDVRQIVTAPRKNVNRHCLEDSSPLNARRYATPPDCAAAVRKGKYATNTLSQNCNLFSTSGNPSWLPRSPEANRLLSAGAPPLPQQQSICTAFSLTQEMKTSSSASL